MTRTVLLLFLTWTVAGSTACFLGSGGEVVTLEVGPETVECVGEAVQRCLRVREHPGDAWRNFYDPIQGFTHEEGFLYRLSVLRERVSDPVADQSSFSWRLLRVLSKEPVEG
jgi:hypothetical protein